VCVCLCVPQKYQLKSCILGWCDQGVGYGGWPLIDSGGGVDDGCPLPCPAGSSSTP
jgi:hypothetical protein